jgi:hypothetical protein
MSMWLMLAKVPPAMLDRALATPEILDGIFTEDDPPAGFDPRRDLLGCDYRTLLAVARARAGSEEAGSEEADGGWPPAYPWLGRAVGESPAHGGLQLDYELTYGSAFGLPADAVLQVTAGLVEEGWALLLGGADEGEVDGDEEEPYEFDDFVDVLPFYEAAMREGKAVIGGVG